METKHKDKSPLLEVSKTKQNKYIELNENENTIYQDLRGTAKAVLRGKFIALDVSIRKEEGLPWRSSG